MSSVRRIEVGELTEELKALLSTSFGFVGVVGEISGFKVHQNGNWYFNLKDERAVLACTVWKYTNSQMSRVPKDGQRVVAYGGLDVFAGRGTYSLNVKRMGEIGSGDLARKLEELKARLAAEGLFDPARKRPLPRYPRAIGLATSPTGAALQDLLRVIRDRHPTIPVFVAPCLVQGNGAAQDIARALAVLQQHEAHPPIDVIIVGRGGGSAEDLFCFNEEPVVRAVAACRVPVVSAVGHQTDFTLSDLAADLRAATPSHAAEIVTPRLGDLLALLDDRTDRMDHAARLRLARARERLAQLSRRLERLHPARRVADGRVRQAELLRRLDRAILLRAERARERLEQLGRRVERSAPGPRVAAHRQRVLELRRRLGAGGERQVEHRRRALQGSALQLQALSPLGVLTRGYAIARGPDGRVLREAEGVKPGDALRVQLGSGSLLARVESIHTDEGGRPDAAWDGPPDT